jgi:hypothetical protein
LVFITIIVFRADAIHDFDALDFPLQVLSWLVVFLIEIAPLIEALCGNDFL